MSTDCPPYHAVTVDQVVNGDVRLLLIVATTEKRWDWNLFSVNQSVRIRLNYLWPFKCYTRQRRKTCGERNENKNNLEIPFESSRVELRRGEKKNVGTIQIVTYQRTTSSVIRKYLHKMSSVVAVTAPAVHTFRFWERKACCSERIQMKVKRILHEPIRYTWIQHRKSLYRRPPLRERCDPNGTKVEWVHRTHNMRLK